MARRKRTKEDLQAVLKHLEYEVDMLQMTAQGLASHVADNSAIGNALVESFAIHSRNLIDFLWPEGTKSDHVLAEDFFTEKKKEQWHQHRPAMPQNLKDSRIRGHKEIAHLSYDRLNVFGAKKRWCYAEIEREIIKAYKVFRGLLSTEHLEPYDSGK